MVKATSARRLEQSRQTLTDAARAFIERVDDQQQFVLLCPGVLFGGGTQSPTEVRPYWCVSSTKCTPSLYMTSVAVMCGMQRYVQALNFANISGGERSLHVSAAATRCSYWSGAFVMTDVLVRWC